MEYIFFLLWFVSTIAIFVFGVKFIKFRIDEKNTKGWNLIKAKLTNIFKSKEKQAKKSKFTGQQLKTFLIISVVVSFVSFIGIGVTAPPVEQTTNDNTTITENNNNDIEENVTEDTNTEQDETVEGTEGTELENNAELNEVKDFTEIKRQSLSNIPAYTNAPYVVINDNIPFFNDTDLTTSSYETYSNLDELGRCGVAIASVGKDIMPTADRGNIGSVKPTGWHSVRYQGVDGNYLYNRCHLIGYQLTAENANEKNLITGTRYMNVDGMLPFENMVADYVKETGKHVLYRVTPIFEGNNLLASGVLMEAKSVEDNGQGVQFNVYCYNVQPGIEINYATGNSSGPEYTGTTSSGTSNSSNNSSNGNSNSSGSATQTTPVAPTTPTVTPTTKPEPEPTPTPTPTPQPESKPEQTPTPAPETKPETTPSAPTQNSRTVYRTPTGKRYHLDPDCGGKNSKPTTLDDATSAGLTPCQKCAQ